MQAASTKVIPTISINDHQSDNNKKSKKNRKENPSTAPQDTRTSNFGEVARHAQFGGALLDEN
ncbi:hypothetical protein I5V32_16495 [Stenotrophomonas maltophilia]|uniref:Uncharacterized protein n=1 Tax=Stenotrophomonas maltophilia TaxID=40324 RepID=A0AA41CGV2_STEMA|nr:MULTISPECIES: hypothetical protein [Stenotrophomonas]MBH1586181.1 hypothetical protein [Stenotrophomonas maltophilia]MBH1717721.1 hypothetical protein [Stenotrophomonas maltophilia]MBH1788933.1 hypothetical protein [Stenotrophomonas maltophilia]MCR1819632.1 hypothetical protein [Stenotrophomonas muris]MCU1073624.1 hypothetical protein [Stenotrophomonas maltophilia]